MRQADTAGFFVAKVADVNDVYARGGQIQGVLRSVKPCGQEVHMASQVSKEADDGLGDECILRKCNPWLVKPFLFCGATCCRAE